MVNFVMLLFVGLFADEKKQAYNGGFLTDQRGKYVFMYEGKIVLPEGHDFSLVICDFFRKKPAVLAEEKCLSVNGAERLSNHAAIGHYVAGDVLYRLVFEKTTEGYRYWFTDLAYQPYIKDRYGKLVKASVAPVPLEKEFSKLNKAAWASRRKSAYEAIRRVSEEWNTHLENIGRPRVIEIP